MINQIVAAILAILATKSRLHDLCPELDTFGIFKIFSIIQNFFAFFYRVNLTGSGLFISTCAEIGY